MPSGVPSSWKTMRTPNRSKVSVILRMLSGVGARLDFSKSRTVLSPTSARSANSRMLMSNAPLPARHCLGEI